MKRMLKIKKILKKRRRIVRKLKGEEAKLFFWDLIIKL
jgi:chemotaxis protein histidine kinase CheA